MGRLYATQRLLRQVRCPLSSLSTPSRIHVKFVIDLLRLVACPYSTRLRQSTRTRDGSLHKNQDMATFLTLQWMSLDVSPDNQPKYTHTWLRASDRVKKVKCIWLVYLYSSHSLAAAIPAL